MDTEPLSGNAAIIIKEEPEAFVKGLETISKLTEGTTYLCHESGENVPGGDISGVTAASFSGPHPAGLAGTHMHFLEPPTAEKIVWTIGYNDVIAIGRLMLTGTLDMSRIVALSGPLCARPRLVRTKGH